MLAMLPSILALIQEFAPLLSTATAVGKVIDVLTTAVPVVIQEAKDLTPTIKNVIATLRENDATTDEQWDRLDAIEGVIDAAFDAAASAATDEDA